ncbi:MarR family winged helix-turn-helix transcriptional regulator [Novosphingobium sp. JCM 18896]|uniref:MarR family winged helix-turn-helix transcriptional regulator n=1 Tax=Novosphingobium sp. JCM 18896 TaxID=2989731 RepID=UPI0022216F9D|nr:MarR family transcriptional regulator [Novosphingobium sp. JCM 18896]MCW1429122.1 MarR family transcriptional regulator [Novosphingobium sp. JCM 18896]
MTSKGPLIDPLEHLLGYQLRRASLATLAALSESYEALDLRLTDAIVLRFVGANPGCNQGEISKALGVRRTNMVPVVSGLVDRGLVKRAVADGRTHALTLTPAGQALHAEIDVLAHANEERFFGGFDEETRSVLLRALDTIRARAEG